MKKPAAVFLLLISFLCGKAQKIQTIVPRQVVAGNAFQIQYIITDPSAFLIINTPQFENLQLISGPNYYKGNSFVNGRTQAIENVTYTVVPMKTGTIKIGAVTAKFKNSADEKTDEVIINVIPQPKASFNALSTYTDIHLYAPSSKTDLDKLIDANLFIKTEVDKRICFLGEAITATFKLYSRLQSTSEVINAPSLYGFSVMDMLDINEAHQAVETINGKVFNTSVLRKLQLYPAQTGKLTIDEMQLQNTIEFDDSATGKKIKVEKLLASNPVNIMVKALPLKQPAGYSGAVGQFTMRTELQDSKITENTQGRLVLTINGKGNFIQFGPLPISWPKEFDVFDPVVSDELNKNSVPAEGKRKYIFNFTTDRAGNYILTPISFSFFDPSSRKYKEVRTDSFHLEIIPAFKNEDGFRKKLAVKSSPNLWIYLSGIVAILSIAVLLFYRKEKQKNRGSLLIKKTDYRQKLSEIALQQLTNKQFCSEVQKLLGEVSRQDNLSRQQRQELEFIQQDCQLLIYSDINAEGKKNELQKRTENFLKQLEP